MKLVEYMATPIPIVSTNAPSVRGLSGRDSIFLAKLHAKDFAEIILKVYNLKGELLKKRVLKQNQIAKQYDFDMRAKRYNVWLERLFLDI
jgi:hypothetical protein